MSWFVLLIGVALAMLGSAGTSSLVASARHRLAEAISRRLRGASESFEWFAESDRLVVTSMALLSLGVVLIGIAIPGIFSSATIGEMALLLLFLILPATLLGGSLLPRWLTEPRADRVAEIVAPVLRVLRGAFRIVLPGGQHAVSEDVDTLAREGAATGLGADEEIALVGGVMTFAERPVREVMTPRTDVVAVSDKASYDEVLTLFSGCGYTRLPVFRDTLDELVGMVHAFDLFKVNPGDPLPLRPIAHAPESRTAADVLLDMQRERRHIAVVLDEFGGTSGIVTLEDLLEALVGEISDEDDPQVIPPPHQTDVLECDGAVSVEDVIERFGGDHGDRSAVSFAGYLAERLGRIPMAGERFRLDGLDVDILAATPARVERLLVRSADPERIDLGRGAP